MVFKAYRPSRALQSLVQCYLEADATGNSEDGVHTLFPNGHPGIFFNFGNPGKLIIDRTYTTPPVSIFGQIDHHFTVTHQQGFYSLGVILKPTVPAWLLRVNMAEFTNKAVDGHLVRQDLNMLHAQLEESPSIRGKIAIIEQYLTTLLHQAPQHSTLTDHVLSAMQQQKVGSMRMFPRQFGVSQRSLESQFKNIIGLSPKTYSLILRFKRMEHQLKQLPKIHWRDMTFASEYYDQNHFIKDFKRFTGLTPSDYLLENLEMGRSYLYT